jgi:protein TonB
MLLGVALNFSPAIKKVRVLEITFGTSDTSNVKTVSKQNLVAPKTSPISIPQHFEEKKEILPAAPKSDASLVESSNSDEILESNLGEDSAKKSYFDLIAQLIFKNKRYPRLAYSLGQEGLVVIKLKLNKDGEILDLSLLEESSFKILNEASLDTISAIHRFPAIPKEIGLSELTLRIPIEYKIKM